MAHRLTPLFIVIAFGTSVWGGAALAHMVRDREINFASDYTAPLDALGKMLQGAPQGAASETSSAAPAPTPPPAKQPAMRFGEPVVILDTYNKSGVGQGNAKAPRFTLSQPMKITHLQTYHWNSGKGTPRPGKIGIAGQGAWQAEGRPGMMNVPNAEWIAVPNVVLPAGTYTITDESTATWAYNGSSNGYGFVVVRAAPVIGGGTAPTARQAVLTERQALERVAKVSEFRTWVKAVREVGHRVVYDTVSNAAETCSDATCEWCFRMSEDTPSHRTFFATYCVDGIEGRVSRRE